ncbi:phenylalanine and histidine ammonia-lyase [Annulohypoxylon nitens]|nr:phenylalanine and histidine ammonia-lyase [Annulohypoxylon nitens]
MDHTGIVIKEWQHFDALVNGNNSHSVILTGNALSLPDVVAVSRHNTPACISPVTIESMQCSLKTLQDRIGNGDIIYGVNTGFGGSADIRTKKLVELQRAVIRELHYGVLPPGERDHHIPPLGACLSNHHHDVMLDTETEKSYMPRSWVRAAILIRINSLVSGCSAVRPVIVERMQDLLNYDIIPMIPMRGSISASGDLSPLSYICGAIQGKSSIRILSKDNRQLYADGALLNHNLEPLTLQAKEGLAMTNGTTVSAAAASLALHDAHGLAIFAQILTAMTVEALHGTIESFHPFFSEIRPHPGQIESARNILGFLKGSMLTRINNGAGSVLRQDRYSIRTVPQWIGPILEDLVLAHQQISVECNSVTDNPLVTSKGEFLHGGNFQAKAVTSAMEKVRQGLQGIGRMLFSQCTELVNPVTNRGLPPNLVIEDPSISLIFKGTDLNIAALAAELGFLANPVNHVQTAEMGNQSLNSLALISARYTHTAIEVLSQLMAAHLIAVCQALDLRAMHVQFLESYRPQFHEIVIEHYGAGASSLTKLQIQDNVVPGAEPIVQNLSKTSAGINKAPNGSAHSSPSQNDAVALGGLSELLWSQVLVSFDTTTSMDAEERFIAIAKSLRPVLLDHTLLDKAEDFVTHLEGFINAVSVSMKDSWCSHRDAYLVHGDATTVLGTASKAVYTFVRHSLKVPLMETRNLSTPTTDEILSGCGVHGTQAPTVGSYTSAVYRALRDGTLAKVAVDILKAVVPADSS